MGFDTFETNLVKHFSVMHVSLYLLSILPNLAHASEQPSERILYHNYIINLLLGFDKITIDFVSVTWNLSQFVKF